MSNAKEKWGKERTEKKKKKKNEMKWEEIPISRVVEVRSLNLDLVWKNFGAKIGKIVEDYKTLLFSKFQRKGCVLWELWIFEDYVSNLVFGHISFVWAFLDLQLWDLIDHKGLYMWEKIKVIWICIERDSSI